MQELLAGNPQLLSELVEQLATLAWGISRWDVGTRSRLVAFDLLSAVPRLPLLSAIQSIARQTRSSNSDGGRTSC